MDKLQELLDKEAALSNERRDVINEIIKLRGSLQPHCWGEDDCSTNMLVHCPWRVDCYKG